jgi:hypothetical protein
MADSSFVASNDSMTVNIELGRMWKRSWSSKILSRNVPSENEETHQRDKQFTYNRDSLRAARFGEQSPVLAGFPHPSRRALWPTMPPIQWVTDLARG